MDIIEFIVCVLQFLLQLLDNPSVDLNFFLKGVVVLLLLEQLGFLSLFLFHERLLVLLLLLQLQLEFPLSLGLFFLLLFKSITAFDDSLFHLLQDLLEFFSLLGLLGQLLVRLLDNLLLLGLLLQQLLSRLVVDFILVAFLVALHHCNLLVDRGLHRHLLTNWIVVQEPFFRPARAVSLDFFDFVDVMVIISL